MLDSAPSTELELNGKELEKVSVSVSNDELSSSFTLKEPEEEISIQKLDCESVLDSTETQEEKEEEEWTYPDGGLEAYGVVFGCFILAATNNGSKIIWGSFLQELHKTVYPDIPLSTLNFISGLANFSTTSVTFLSGRLGDRYGHKRMIAIGCTATFFSQLLSAFTYNHLPLIFLFQGLCLGISLGIAMPIYLSLPSQYFFKKRGMATGLATSGTGFGGAISTLVVRSLMPIIGYRYTMLTYAGINVLVWILAYCLIKVRLPPIQPGSNPISKNWLPRGVWSNIGFYSLTLCIAIGVFGFLTPFYYITTYTFLNVPTLSKSSMIAILPLVTINLISGFGRILAGILADKIGPLNALFITFFLGGIFQVLFWPFVHTLKSIFTFSSLYGLFGTWYIGLIPICAASLLGSKNLSTSVGFILLMTAPGQLTGASISGAILNVGGGTKVGSYIGLAVYSGGMMLIGAMILLPARFLKERKIWAKV